jgi:hypothetical protein
MTLTSGDVIAPSTGSNHRVRLGCGRGERARPPIRRCRGNQVKHPDGHQHCARWSRFIVKAGGGNDRHIEREIRAHLNWLVPWTSRGRAPLWCMATRERRSWSPDTFPASSSSAANMPALLLPTGRQAGCSPCSTPRPTSQTMTTTGARTRNRWRGSRAHTHGAPTPDNSWHAPAGPGDCRYPGFAGARSTGNALACPAPVLARPVRGCSGGQTPRLV